MGRSHSLLILAIFISYTKTENINLDKKLAVDDVQCFDSPFIQLKEIITRSATSQKNTDKSVPSYESRKNYSRVFPEGFRFGTATSSYQVEGAWDEDGKSENIWDYLTHTNPTAIIDGSNGDIADNSYHLYKRDVEMMREMGLDYYRFSLSWTRIIPTSFPNKINKAGVQYYNNLIDEMLKYNIEPMVTLYHWDLPQKLQEMGGWTNPYIVDWFGDYARIAFDLFGDRVKTWITINEPHIICFFGYGAGYMAMAPQVNYTGISDYICSKNLLLAHARAYHIYDTEFKETQGGRIAITLDAQWYEPASQSNSDIEAAEDYHLFTWQLFANPIFSKSGDYPAKVKDIILAKSTTQGFFGSRLPEFTPQEIEYVRGTSDFLGLNHYSTLLVYRNESVMGTNDEPSFMDDLGVQYYQLSDWKLGEVDNVMFAPVGFYKLLMKIKEKYNNPTVFITENGFATHEGINDKERVIYHQYYINAMLDAIDNGCDVRRYTAWSLMDNFEWTTGYTVRLGLYQVDYSDPNRTRTPRKSAFVYKEMLRTRKLDLTYDPEDISAAAMTIDLGH